MRYSMWSSAHLPPFCKRKHFGQQIRSAITGYHDSTRGREHTKRLTSVHLSMIRIMRLVQYVDSKAYVQSPLKGRMPM